MELTGINEEGESDTSVEFVDPTKADDVKDRVVKNKLYSSQTS